MFTGGQFLTALECHSMKRTGCEIYPRDGDPLSGGALSPAMGRGDSPLWGKYPLWGIPVGDPPVGDPQRGPSEGPLAISYRL